jgi:hypothetical protein
MGWTSVMILPWMSPVIATPMPAIRVINAPNIAP